MFEILGKVLTPSLLYAAIRTATPVIYAALCCAVTMQAGILNIGTEGIMLMGAWVGVAFSYFSGSWVVGVLAGMAAGMIIASILALGSIKYKAAMPAICTGMNMLILAFTRFLLGAVFDVNGTFADPKINAIPRIHLAFLEGIPFIGDVFNDWCVTEILMILVVIVLAYVFYKTRWGLRLRAVGKNELAAKSVGINVVKIQYQALIFSGALGGLAGAHLSLGYSNMFVQNMTNNRGFVGLASMWFGGGDPALSALGGFIFGLFESIGSRLQPYGLPSQLSLAIPYAIILIILAIAMINKKRVTEKKKKPVITQDV